MCRMESRFVKYLDDINSVSNSLFLTDIPGVIPLMQEYNDEEEILPFDIDSIPLAVETEQYDVCY